MKPAPLLLACAILAGCSSPSPTEPAALALHNPSEPRPTLTPAPTPHLALGFSGGVVARPTPCFPNPYDACGVGLRPTLGPGQPTPTPDAGNLGGAIVPGSGIVTIWPDPTPTP